MMTVDSRLRKIPHMHWITIIALFFALASIWGSTVNTASLFITPIQETLQATRPQMVMGTTVKGLGNILGAFICAFLLKRMPVMQVIRLAALLLTGSVFAMSYVNSLLQYYLAIIFQTSMTSIGAYVPMSIVIQNWFEKHVTGYWLCFYGFRFRGMIYNYLGGPWIPAFGWRRTLFLFGIITLISLFITLFVIVRATPYHLNLRPYGAADDFELTDVTDDLPGVEMKDALKSIRFWIFISAIFLVTMTTNALFNNLSPHLIDIGYSLPQAAQVSSAFMLFLMIGKPVIGYAFESLGLKAASIICTLAIALGVLSAILAGHKIFLITLVVGAGMGFSFSSIAYPAFSKSLFGAKNYASFASFLQISAGAGMLVGPIVTGLLYQYSKSYILNFILALVYSTISILIWLFVLPKRGHEPY